jgi:hypothetical protein
MVVSQLLSVRSWSSPALAEDVGDPRSDAHLDQLDTLKDCSAQFTVEVHQFGHVLKPRPWRYLVKAGDAGRVCRVEEAEGVEVAGETVVADRFQDSHGVGVVLAGQPARLEKGELLGVEKVRLGIRHDCPQTREDRPCRESR